MKVLLITDGLYPYVLGGMQKHAYNLVRQFAKNNISLTVVHACNPDHPTPEIEAIIPEFPLAPVEFIRIPFPPPGKIPGHYLRNSWKYSRAVENHLKNRNTAFDIAIAKGFTALAFLKNKSHWNIPIAIQMHGLEMFEPYRNLRDAFEKWLLKMPARYLLNNADYMLGYGGKVKETALQNGMSNDRFFEQYGAVDQSWLLPEPPNKSNGPKRTFLFVARFETRKGFAYLSQALKSEKLKNASFTFHIVGKVPIEKQWSDPRIIWHGNLTAQEIKTLANESEVLVVPSLAEGFPTIIIEAMARKMAVIGTEVGAIPAILNEQNGWLIEPANTSSLISAIINAIALPPAFMEQKQKAAQKMVQEKFNWEAGFAELVLNLQFMQNDYRERTTRA